MLDAVNSTHSEYQEKLTKGKQRKISRNVEKVGEISNESIVCRAWEPSSFVVGPSFSSERQAVSYLFGISIICNTPKLSFVHLYSLHIGWPVCLLVQYSFP